MKPWVESKKLGEKCWYKILWESRQNKRYSHWKTEDCFSHGKQITQNWKPNSTRWTCRIGRMSYWSSEKNHCRWRPMLTQVPWWPHYKNLRPTSEQTIYLELISSLTCSLSFSRCLKLQPCRSHKRGSMRHWTCSESLRRDKIVGQDGSRSCWQNCIHSFHQEG